MRPVFREDKATQVACRLLQLSGTPLSVLKLVKLVYLADRTSLQRFGRPITFDTFYAMTHGPVVSSTMDCINAMEDEAPIWSSFISPRAGNEVSLIKPADPKDLSRVEENVLDEIIAEHGAKTPGELRNFTHGLPEYSDPSPSKRKRIRYRDVLGVVGWSVEDIEEAIADLTAEITAARLVG